ncbi:MAG: hypothetical protein KHY83_12455, partial [Coriobacteriia bacterium]|nr:hypothetical protein [Coriobacteriia bacterium]
MENEDVQALGLNAETLSGRLKAAVAESGKSKEEIAKLLAEAMGRASLSTGSINRYLNRPGEYLCSEYAGPLCKAIGVEWIDVLKGEIGQEGVAAKFERLRKEAAKILRIYMALGPDGQNVLLRTGVALLKSGHTQAEEIALECIRDGDPDGDDYLLACESDRKRAKRITPDSSECEYDDLGCPSQDSLAIGEWLARKALGEDDPDISSFSWSRPKGHRLHGR